MRILFDRGTPEPLNPFLNEYAVIMARDLSWEYGGSAEFERPQDRKEFGCGQTQTKRQTLCKPAKIPALPRLF
jgi:hypothetical protein